MALLEKSRATHQGSPERGDPSYGVGVGVGVRPGVEPESLRGGNAPERPDERPAKKAR